MQIQQNLTGTLCLINFYIPPIYLQIKYPISRNFNSDALLGRNRTDSRKKQYQSTKQISILRITYFLTPVGKDTFISRFTQQIKKQMDFIEADSILDIKNSKLGSYDFLVSSGDRNEGQYFCNDFVGLPSIPIIGKYGKNGYEMNEVALLTAHECFCDAQSNKIVTSSTQEEINLPQKVKNIIFTIPEVIKHNKPITDDNEDSEKHQQYKNKNKKPNTIPEFHPYEFPPAMQLNFMWSVSFQNKRIFTKATPNFMNIVFHPYIYQTIIFETTKRMFTNIPVCMIKAGEDESTCGVKYWDKDQRSISFNSLRSEYLSVHMKGPSLCFSPNNMKFEMNPEQDIVHFFTFVLTEDGFYHIVYHWNINDFNLHGPLSKLFKSQSTTRQIIDNLPSVINPNHPALKQLKSLFSVSKVSEESKSNTTQQSEQKMVNEINPQENNKSSDAMQEEQKQQ